MSSEVPKLTESVHSRGTYEARVRCGNCNHQQRLKIPKGTPISTAKCPNCGCETLSKDPWWYP